MTLIGGRVVMPVSKYDPCCLVIHHNIRWMIGTGVKGYGRQQQGNRVKEVRDKRRMC